MQYSPKLKNALKEIKKIVENYDIGAVVVLHDVGNSEYYLKLDPSYSCASFNGDELRVKAKLQEDFNGDLTEFQNKKSSTSNMLHLLADTTGRLAINLIKISEAVDNKMGATHFGGGNTSNTTQNN